jgi:hypothetical protein
MLSDCLATEAALSRSGPSRTEADPLGHRGRRGERDQRLVVAVDDAVDGPEGREAAPVGSPRPLGQLLAGGSRHRVRKPDPNVHVFLLIRFSGWRKPSPLDPPGRKDRKRAGPARAETRRIDG